MSQPKCIKCGKGGEGLIVINVRDKQGRIRIQEWVHGPCWDEDPEWVKRQVHGKNPKFYYFGGKK